MKITDVKPRRRSLYQLVIDGVDGPEIDKKTWDESPYTTGAKLSTEEFDNLMALATYNRARDKALYLLGLRDYACRELEKKLTAEYAPHVAAAVVARLAELSLLDDEQYARRKAVALQQYKGYPRRRIEQELCRLGVEREVARAAVEELDGEDYGQALALIEKKYYNKLNDENSRRKVEAALARRGFSYGAIRRAMELAGAHDNNEEYDQWQ